VRWVDPHGHDLVGAEAAIRSWIQLVMRVAFAVYLAFEVRALWIGRGDVQAALEASTRTLLVALLLVFTQMLDWYFVWPTTLGAALAWRGSVARAALVYAVLYPPIFYASHENLLTTPVVVPVLLLFAILPILIVQIGRGEIPGIIVPRDEGCHRLSARQS
jgi:hypothetical protein